MEDTSSTFEKFDCHSCQSRGVCYNRDKPGEYCSLHVSYQEGSSWSAFQGRDVTYLGGPHDVPVEVKMINNNKENSEEEEEGNLMNVVHSGVDPQNAADYSFDMTFGCQTSITGLFKTQLVRYSLWIYVMYSFFSPCLSYYQFFFF
jgi:hypothetical protein